MSPDSPSSPNCSVEIRFFGVVQSALRCSEERLACNDGTTIAELLLRLAAQHGDSFRDAMFVGESTVPNATIVVDGRDIRHGRGLLTTVKNGTVVQLIVMPPASGGG